MLGNLQHSMLGKQGFTFIELMVVIAIVGVLAATAIVNTGKNDDRGLRMEAERLKTFLRDVQNKALAVEKVSGVTGKVCGFGVSYSAGTPNKFQPFYVVTEDLDSGKKALDVECSSADVSKKNEDVDGSSAIDYEDLFYMKSGFSANLSKDIFFLSPHGEIYYDGTAISSDGISFNLQNSGIGTSVSVPITILPKGVIK